MLEAVPTNFFSTRFLLMEKGKIRGEIESAVLREAAQLDLEDGTYLLYKEGFMSGEFILELDGKVVARATKPSIWKSDFDVVLSGDRGVSLRKPSLFKRSFTVLDGKTKVGDITPTGAFTRRANIEVPAEWPLAERVFLFWLCFLIWKRQSQAAAS